MRRQNGYLAKRQEAIERWRVAERDTWIQYMVDTLILTLNDPEAMGKDTFSGKRVRRVVEVWQRKMEEFRTCLNADPEADYYQAKLDENLIAILSERDFQPFGERYDWIRLEKY